MDPHGKSVNDDTCTYGFSFLHQSPQMGRGSLLAKFDIQEAYRIVPIHPGIVWNNQLHIDTFLPFGAPLIFTALADALQWAIQQ